MGTNWQRFQVSQTPYSISAFGEDEQGRLDLADAYTGRIYQMTDSHSALAPTMSSAGGSFNNDQSVVANTITPGATIYYTTDGSDPIESDPAVTSGGTINVGATMTLKIRAFRADLLPSAVTSTDFSFLVTAPAFSPDTGPITNGTLVTITSATVGAILNFTLDGSDPSSNSPTYAGPIPLNGNSTLRAAGTKPGYADSDITSTFVNLLPVSTPTFSPAQEPVTNGAAIT